MVFNPFNARPKWKQLREWLEDRSFRQLDIINIVDFLYGGIESSGQKAIYEMKYKRGKANSMLAYLRKKGFPVFTFKVGSDRKTIKGDYVVVHIPYARLPKILRDLEISNKLTRSISSLEKARTFAVALLRHFNGDLAEKEHVIDKLAKQVLECKLKFPLPKEEMVAKVLVRMEDRKYKKKKKKVEA